MTIDEFSLQHSTEEKDVSDRAYTDDALWNQVVVCFGIFIGYNNTIEFASKHLTYEPSGGGKNPVFHVGCIWTLCVFNLYSIKG